LSQTTVLVLGIPPFFCFRNGLKAVRKAPHTFFLQLDTWSVDLNYTVRLVAEWKFPESLLWVDAVCKSNDQLVGIPKQRLLYVDPEEPSDAGPSL
jgi:hypothetical protein